MLFDDYIDRKYYHWIEELIPRDELMRMVLDGRIVSGPLMILALWLDRRADELRQELAPL